MPITSSSSVVYLSTCLYLSIVFLSTCLAPLISPSTKPKSLAANQLTNGLKEKNIAKGTTDPRVEFSLPMSSSQVQTQILIKFHLQNLDQASSS